MALHSVMRSGGLVIQNKIQSTHICVQKTAIGPYGQVMPAQYNK